MKEVTIGRDTERSSKEMDLSCVKKRHKTTRIRIPVASGGISFNTGYKHTARRNSRPQTTDANPVTAPKAYAMKDSTKRVVAERPKREEATLKRASTKKIRGII